LRTRGAAPAVGAGLVLALRCAACSSAELRGPAGSASGIETPQQPPERHDGGACAAA
jgi:hypothetical protein